jgi:hypothetical protein
MFLRHLAVIEKLVAMPAGYLISSIKELILNYFGETIINDCIEYKKVPTN